MKVVFWLIQGNITNWIQTFRQFTQEMYNLSSVFHALLRSTTWTHEALLRVNIFSVWVWIVANASSFVFFVCTHTECVSVGLHTCASWPRWEHRGGNGRKKAALSEACNVLGFGIYIGKIAGRRCIATLGAAIICSRSPLRFKCRQLVRHLVDTQNKDPPETRYHIY